MAGTTGLELATSAVTVSGIQVLSTTWKITDGTASHRKYTIANANVYRGSSIDPNASEPGLQGAHPNSRLYILPGLQFSLPHLLPRFSQMVFSI
jgi:hypothetical protein